MKCFKKNKNNEFPAQNGPLKVMTKNGSKWRAFSACRMQISVGQEKHEGLKFSALLEWCSIRFDSVTICVNDTLQRFNLLREYPYREDIAVIRSRQDGDSWIDRNVPPGTEVGIVRWDHWRSHIKFSDMLRKVYDLYENDYVFRSAIKLETEAFAKRNKVMVTDKLNKLCSDFLLEETAVFSLMISDFEAVDIYPGTTLLPMRLIQDGKIFGIELKNKSHFTRVDFHRR